MSVAYRYFTRSPRYVLQTFDETLLRFASLQTRGQSSSTKVLNLSETGLAFEIHPDDAPSEGDVLKVEFDVPHQSRIACFATVTRIEPGELFHLVGLQFRNLPKAYRRLLAQGLKDCVNTELVVDWQNFRRKQLATFAGVSVATLALLFLMTVPTESWIRTLRMIF